jgi:hypothetical protein
MPDGALGTGHPPRSTTLGVDAGHFGDRVFRLARSRSTASMSELIVRRSLRNTNAEIGRLVPSAMINTSGTGMSRLVSASTARMVPAAMHTSSRRAPL